MSRGGWIVVGIVVGLLLVPSGVAVAKGALRYTGIEGTSLNTADVTAGGQLLTTEAKPTSFQEYQGFVQAAEGLNSGSDCETVGSAIPSGDGFVMQQILVDVYVANLLRVDGTSGHTSEAGGVFVADSPTQACGAGTDVAAFEAPQSDVGDVTLPLAPGYVIPSGYRLDFLGFGLDAGVVATGYLVPASDAPSLPPVEGKERP